MELSENTVQKFEKKKNILKLLKLLHNLIICDFMNFDTKDWTTLNYSFKPKLSPKRQ